MQTHFLRRNSRLLVRVASWTAKVLVWVASTMKVNTAWRRRLRSAILRAVREGDFKKGPTVFEFLFGPKNPTKSWRRAADLRLEFDLELGILNGVKLGEPLNKLFDLGPIDDLSWLQNQDFGWFALGLRVSCWFDDNLIEGFEIVLNDPLMPQFRPFPGPVYYQGRCLDLAKQSESDFVNRFGTPYWRDEAEIEILLFYEFPGREWQVELNKTSAFNSLAVTSNPILADAQQRAAYGVTKPWPPQENEPSRTS